MKVKMEFSRGGSYATNGNCVAFANIKGEAHYASAETFEKAEKELVKELKEVLTVPPAKEITIK